MVDVPNPLSVLDAPGGFPGLPSGGLITRGVRRGPLRRVRHEPLMWLSDGPVDAPAAGYPAPAGLLPVLLHDRPHLEEWWHGGTLDPRHSSDPDGHRAGQVLREFWAQVVPDPEEGAEGEELIAPFGRSWPGLAPPGTPAAEPAAAAAALGGELLAQGWFGRPRLALVPARRGADVPAVLGWAGPLLTAETDTARVSAVLRSWEDRFGARVLAIGYDRLDLSVAAPPRSLAEALPVAAEHFAFCPDYVWQGSGTVRDYAAEALVGAAHWSFWWD
ncbi:DUF4253 domain-containing protein [Streptomyces sp. NPDC090077]|uniref:DUF4253 domain-containing protein n=1 Tax=Streptomyces sp. NPDC090077 TaxID=3365938 RepID=UPI0037F5492B